MECRHIAAVGATLLVAMVSEKAGKSGVWLNALMRWGYRGAYAAARVWWFVRRPRTNGALVALWHEERLLLVRTSYRPQCTTLPGGFQKRGESARDAASREVHEELGVLIRPDLLSPAWHGSLTFEHREDVVTIWEVALESAPPARANGREIVWVGWKTAAEALSGPLLPHVCDYLRTRQSQTIS